MTRCFRLHAALTAATLSISVPAVAQVAAPRGGPFARALAQEPTAGFSVVLVLGDSQVGGTADSVPAAASKALADLKDFLPYKSYQLLDSQWSMGADRVSSRLRGTDGKEYELQLVARQGFGNVAVTRFLLREINAAADASQTKDLMSALDPQLSVNHPLVKKLTTVKLPGTIIDTSFSMDVGETVVVGTSRLQGSKALIVLITAVGRPQPATR